MAESPWDWIERRMRVLPLRRYQETAPHAPQFDWQVSDEFRPVRQGNEQEELRIAHLSHTPGSHCSAGDVKPVSKRVALQGR